MRDLSLIFLIPDIICNNILQLSRRQTAIDTTHTRIFKILHNQAFVKLLNMDVDGLFSCPIN